MTSYVIAIGSGDFSVHDHDYSEIEIKMETGSLQDDYSNRHGILMKAQDPAHLPSRLHSQGVFQPTNGNH